MKPTHPKPTQNQIQVTIQKNPQTIQTKPQHTHQTQNNINNSQTIQTTPKLNSNSKSPEHPKQCQHPTLTTIQQIPKQSKRHPNNKQNNT